MNGNQNYNQTNNVIPNPQNNYNNVPNSYFNQPSTPTPIQPNATNGNTFFNAPNNNQTPSVPVSNQPIVNTNTVIGNQVNNQLPIGNQANSQTNSQIVLGTVSNVTYSDTLGDISNNPNNQTSNTANSYNSDYSNQFINDNNYNQTMINDLNVEGTYNDMAINSSVDYMNDPKVQENLSTQKKKTVTISKELKTVFILVLILFAFTFVIPILSDLLNKFRFR